MESLILTAEDIRLLIISARSAGEATLIRKIPVRLRSVIEQANKLRKEK